jgi:hypothetical protein
MMALGFAMTATAKAGPVIHAEGMGAGRHRPLRTSEAGAPTTGTEPTRSGFYDSMTQPAAPRG